jgi:hypothetical protein
MGDIRSEDVDGGFVDFGKYFEEVAVGSFAGDGSLGGVLEEFAQVFVHLCVLS